jgi:pullulanase/glycogen debranching enzyme
MGLLGDQIVETNDHGERIIGKSFLLLFNASNEHVRFQLDGRSRNVKWELVLDTARPAAKAGLFDGLTEYPLQPRSVAVLCPDLSGVRPQIPTL